VPSYQIRADIFPVNLELTKDDEVIQYDKARVILTLDHVYVFQDATPKPTVVFEDRLTSYTPPVPQTRVRKASQLLDRTAQFSTEDGYNARFVKTGGCGCGSRLKTASLDSIMPNDSIAQAASSNDSL
jgi:hypothetical protein